ncbi:hypothetical protein D9M68_914920 [compost metagenome]
MQGGERSPADAGLVRYRTGRLGGLLAGGFADLAEATRLPVFQLLAGQGPADGAIAQGGYRVGQAGVDQRLGTDDAAGPPGAVDDHPSGRVRRQFAGTQDQLGARHADAGGDAHGLVFIETAGVEHHHIGLGVEQGFDLFGGQ